MLDITSLDYLYIAVIIVSSIWAWFRGGIFEIITTASWITAALMARFLAPQMNTVIQALFNLSSSSLISLATSYFLVFFITLGIAHYMATKVQGKIHESSFHFMDKSLGILFGVIRGIAVMGIVYWGAIWYYSTDPQLPSYISNAKSRPVMQVTALKLHKWFIPGKNKLLERDARGLALSDENIQETYENLINPKVRAEKLKDNISETGYRENERESLNNRLLQLEASNPDGDDPNRLDLDGSQMDSLLPPSM